METAVVGPLRRPRFRRVPPPAFDLTDGDVEIIRHIAQHRFLRSTHIAQLVGRSLGRTNDRLERLFHAGYVDRPRAQLDRFPVGSSPMLYALADRGARLLRQRDGLTFRNVEWSRKNREVRRPFIEHQIEIVNFQVGLQRAVAERNGIRLIPSDDMNSAASRRPMPTPRAPFSFRAKLPHRGRLIDAAVVPDFVFGLQFLGGPRWNYVVEIDRGTMPVRRSDPEQTSIARKMRVYLAAHAAKQHQRQFGWKNFRALIVTTDHRRIATMIDAAQQLATRGGPGASLFWFASFADIAQGADLLALNWRDGAGRTIQLG
jgi:DNA-binding Lrp family transcriptional regulator